MRQREIPKPSLVAVFESFGLRVLGREHGGWRKAECPLPDHEDHNPSASLNEDECRWRCHACAESGDAIDLFMLRNPNARWPDACRWAESFLDDAGREVRSDGGGSSLLPRRPGNRPAGRKFTPPWSRL